VNILVIGSGGREHALAWKLAQSPRVKKLYIAPGNAGTAQVGENVDIAITDLPALRDFARENQVDLTVVGPDDVLAAGLVDVFAEKGLKAFGPNRLAARLESSKSFAKDFMRRHGIPTARAEKFQELEKALAALKDHQYPLAVKADGLALGKGVIIARNEQEAEEAVRGMLEEKRFGIAGSTVLLEEFLEGQECSIHAVIDGSNYVLLPVARDHKQIGEGDTGPNTGGMGTFTPPPLADDNFIQQIKQQLMQPFMEGLKKDGLNFQGLLFPGLMLTKDGFKVLEFNCRFGDPETQSILPRLRTDLVDVLEAAVNGTLDQCRPEWDPRTACCVVMASGGYPGSYEKGKVIIGIEQAEAAGEVVVFHAGTKRDAEGRLVTSGGRVLGVAALGHDLPSARDRAYGGVAKIHFDDAVFRRDIGAKDPR
jgi:phosphoribosylamine--glycine ligase